MVKRGHAIKAAFLGLTGLACALGGQASAADMPMPYYGDAPQEKVEFGTGWYIRGDVGGSLDSGPVLSPDLAFLGNKTQANWNADVGFGYKYNSWFRSDLTLGALGSQKSTGIQQVGCYQRIANVIDPTTQNSVGVYAVPNTCNETQRANLKKQILLLNGYFDLGTWYGVTPYIGAGLGAARVEQEGSRAYTNASDNSAYRANLVLPEDALSNPTYLEGPALVRPLNPQPVIAYGIQNWDRRFRTVKYNFAWALMAGAAWQMTDNAYLDVGYRYVNFGRFTGISSITGATVSKDLSAHQIRIGVRYMVD